MGRTDWVTVRTIRTDSALIFTTEPYRSQSASLTEVAQSADASTRPSQPPCSSVVLYSHTGQGQHVRGGPIRLAVHRDHWRANPGLHPRRKCTNIPANTKGSTRLDSSERPAWSWSRWWWRSSSGPALAPQTTTTRHHQHHHAVFATATCPAETPVYAATSALCASDDAVYTAPSPRPVRSAHGSPLVRCVSACSPESPRQRSTARGGGSALTPDGSWKTTPRTSPPAAPGSPPYTAPPPTRT